MPLNFVNIRPGFNKQITPTAAEGQYIDGDNVRFRYGLPEKIGGWEQLTDSTIVGAARAQHQWTDLDGRRYVVIGTHKALILYYSEAFYDITPLDTAITGATFDTFSSHYIVNNEFREAISKFLNEEENRMNIYMEELEDRLPFKQK